MPRASPAPEPALGMVKSGTWGPPTQPGDTFREDPQAANGNTVHKVVKLGFNRRVITLCTLREVW